MTAIELQDVSGVDREPSPVLTLAAQEGRRLALHPVFGVLVAMWIATLVLGTNGPRDAFEMVTSAVTWFFGVPALLLANLTASRDRRAGSTELLAASPVSARSRDVALCLAALAPAAGCAALVASAHAVLLALGQYDAVPSVWHLAAGPLTVLGGALLGIMVARWFPVPGAVALVVVALVAWNVAAANAAPHLQPLGTYVSWAMWPAAGTADWAGYVPGSAALHAAYLLGLCAMAATGTFLPGARRPAVVLGIGAALTALTGVLAWAQLT
jgi:ABC-type multidrug transport system permease subunit